MSVSLWISWPDGRTEEVLVASQETAAVAWAAIAKRLELCHYTGAFPMFVDRANIEAIAVEIRAIRDAVAKGEQPGGLERLARLIDYLDRLNKLDGWEAEIG